jgi:hypothetical protein
MNKELKIDEVYLKGNIKLGFGLALSFSLAFIAPIIGEVIRRKSISKFDVFELFSFLILPLMYIGIAKAIYSYRLSKFETDTPNKELKTSVNKYRLLYILAIVLLCFYQAFITIVISPGGPEELKGTFWLWTILYIFLYGILIISAERYLRKAIRAMPKV